MSYATTILKRNGRMKGAQPGGRKKQFVDTAPCAYCGGTGEDPKYGNRSICPVCQSSGKVGVKPPVVTCLKCHGTGRDGGDLTCLACRGIGVVSVPTDAGTCPKCKGTGEDGGFYCSACQGQGVA